MNREKLERVGVDYEDGLRRFAYNEELYRSYLYRFMEEKYYEKMVTALGSGDAEMAFEQAHTLKGVVGTLGMQELFKDLIPVVERFRNGDITDYAQMLAPMRKSYEQIIEAIEEE